MRIEKEPTMADTNTVVGQTILIKGNLQGDEDLTVQGRIEGSINLTKTLIVEPTGVVKADASVCNAVVSGVVVGNLTATDSVELTESGRMVGDIRAPRVIINEGALFKGQVDMGDIDSRGGESRPAAARSSQGRLEPVRKVPFLGKAAASSKPVGKGPAIAPKAEPKVEPKPEAKGESKSAKKNQDEEEAVTTSKKKVVVKKRR
jgi:cytoskeletal protein CcmA (bactofilin family)